MGLDNAIYAMSTVNTLLGNVFNYNDAVKNGTAKSDALMNLGMNTATGIMQNAVARNIQENTGSYIGYALTSMGNKTGNTVAATNALMLASIMSSPQMMYGCNPFMTSSIYGCGPYGRGFVGNYFGSSCCGNPFMFAGPSMFGMNGFWC